jgi:hypothetical protein
VLQYSDRSGVLQPQQAYAEGDKPARLLLDVINTLYRYSGTPQSLHTLYRYSGTPQSALCECTAQPSTPQLMHTISPGPVPTGYRHSFHHLTGGCPGLALTQCTVCKRLTCTR